MIARTMTPDILRSRINAAIRLTRSHVRIAGEFTIDESLPSIAPQLVTLAVADFNVDDAVGLTLVGKKNGEWWKADYCWCGVELVSGAFVVFHVKAL